MIDLNIVTIVGACFTCSCITAAFVAYTSFKKDMQYLKVKEENNRLKAIYEEKEKYFEKLEEERRSHIEEIKKLSKSINPSQEHKEYLEKMNNRFFDMAEKAQLNNQPVIIDRTNNSSNWKSPKTNHRY